MVGETFGGYKAVSKLGSGGMGEVFLAEHQLIVRRVAIKVLVPELTQNAEVVQRFLREARATSLIRHPGIVEVFDCDVHPGGRAYIVMEYLEGETLADKLDRDGPLPVQAACAIAQQIADALAAAHERGIVHRDLKPENIFLCSPSPGQGKAPARVKVLDFGVAKLFADDTPVTSRTRTGALLGTPTYMSPEQCGGRPDIDHRTDVYALGCMLFEMVVGRPPFSSARRTRELLRAHLFQPAPSLAEACPRAPRWLDRLVASMMAKEPAGRPGSMREVATTLAEAEASHGGAAEAEAATGGSPRRRRLRTAGIALAAAVLLAAGIGLAAGLLPSRRSPAGPSSSPVVVEVTSDVERRAASPVLTAPSGAAPVALPDRRVSPGGRRPSARGAPAAAPRAGAAAPATQHGPVLDTDGIVDL